MKDKEALKLLKRLAGRWQAGDRVEIRDVEGSLWRGRVVSVNENKPVVFDITHVKYLGYKRFLRKDFKSFPALEDDQVRRL